MERTTVRWLTDLIGYGQEAGGAVVGRIAYV